MSFEAVLCNKEFELVVFEVTFAVVTRRSASVHGVMNKNIHGYMTVWYTKGI
jgi:hypothetical protein